MSSSWTKNWGAAWLMNWEMQCGNMCINYFCYFLFRLCIKVFLDNFKSFFADFLFNLQRTWLIYNCYYIEAIAILVHNRS